jgi:hypothetical protein
LTTCRTPAKRVKVHAWHWLFISLFSLITLLSGEQPTPERIVDHAPGHINGNRQPKKYER